jgi:hypothetical protein
MGGGGSSCYKSYEQKQLEEQRRKIREIAERDAWLKHHRVGEDEMKWWNSAWWGLYKWLKEKQLWETELQRRKERDGVGGDYLPLRDHHE